MKAKKGSVPEPPKLKTYGYAKSLAKLFSPVFNVLFFVLVGAAVMLVILVPIIAVIDTPVDQMLLPPFMKQISDASGNTVSFDIFLGNGVKVVADANNVALSDIKTVIYAGIVSLLAIMLVIAPITKFLSLLLKNIGSGDIFNEKNPRLMMFIGLCALIGNPLILFVGRFYNYYLLTTFVRPVTEKIQLSLGFDFYGLVFGALVILFGAVYGYSCEKARMITLDRNAADTEIVKQESDL
ncbi:MAG: DUF2975 domain-containing protein [Oscillospiraceae bacterium]|nr:DUF2975 domain-containing protein [Oscillospiraceae bacterium]